MMDEEIKHLREINKELLSALEKIQVYYEDYTITYIPMNEIREVLRRAIKKAKGEV